MARSPSPENVTDLIAKPTAEYVPEPRYVSRYRDKIRKAAKRGKSAHKTLGVPNVVLNPPGEFLRKQTNVIPRRPEVHHEHYHKPGYQHKLPDWEPIKASDKDAQLSQNRVDFTKRNIDEARKLRPAKPRKYYVDDRHGTVHALKPSGLYPTYRNSKNYGQVPGKNSPTMRRSEPKQKSRGASPQLEHKIKARKHENTDVKHEIGPRKHEDKRDKNKMNEPKKHENKRDRHKIKSPRKHEEKQYKHESKDRKKPEQKYRDEKRNVQNYNKRANRDEMKDQNYEERSNRDERKDQNFEDREETKSEKKYENEDREEADEAKIEIRSLQSADEIRRSVSQYEMNDELTSRGSVQQPRCRYVTEDERDELLYGMKKKWDEMMKKFQCLPFLTDTPPKVVRKSTMEKDLLQLEKDIQIIERHPYIYVYSDSEDGC